MRLAKIIILIIICSNIVGCIIWPELLPNYLMVIANLGLVYALLVGVGEEDEDGK